MKLKSILTSAVLLASLAVPARAAVVTAEPDGYFFVAAETAAASGLPEYDGEPYVEINGGKAYFDADDITTEPFESYSALDAYGRAGEAYANICPELMPEEERGDIESVTPAGWHSVKYESVPGKYLYNRCHLIAFRLAGENANEKNLITGTRYLNVEGMLPFEDEVGDYVDRTGNHVLYRVTPAYTDNNLIADGVYMEAYSVEDNGKGVNFNVYCFNVQPGVTIDYATGDSREGEGEMLFMNIIYVIDMNRMVYHKKDCAELLKVDEYDRADVIGTGTDIWRYGYEPCTVCQQSSGYREDK